MTVKAAAVELWHDVPKEARDGGVVHVVLRLSKAHRRSRVAYLNALGVLGVRRSCECAAWRQGVSHDVGKGGVRVRST